MSEAETAKLIAESLVVLFSIFVVIAFIAVNVIIVPDNTEDDPDRVAKQPIQSGSVTYAEQGDLTQDDGHKVDPIFKTLDLTGHDKEGRTFAELHAERCAVDRANYYHRLVSNAMGAVPVEEKADTIFGKFYEDGSG